MSKKTSTQVETTEVDAEQVVAAVAQDPIPERKKVSEMSEEELRKELDNLTTLMETIKFSTPATAEQFKQLKNFLQHRATWSGVNAFAIYELFNKVGTMYDASAKTFTFSHTELEALRFLLQKYESRGYDDAKMFVEIMKLINIPLQEATMIAQHYSEIENALTAKVQGIELADLNLETTDVARATSIEDIAATPPTEL